MFFPVVPNKLGKVKKYEFFKNDVNNFFRDIEWGQIDPKGNRRVKKKKCFILKVSVEFGLHRR